MIGFSFEAIGQGSIFDGPIGIIPNRFGFKNVARFTCELIDLKPQVWKVRFYNQKQAGDILLIAGKGHEKYQEINGVKHDFDDFQLTEEFFNQLKK